MKIAYAALRLRLAAHGPRNRPYAGPSRVQDRSPGKMWSPSTCIGSHDRLAVIGAQLATPSHAAHVQLETCGLSLASRRIGRLRLEQSEGCFGGCVRTAVCGGCRLELNSPGAQCSWPSRWSSIRLELNAKRARCR